jgi:hypothetical protein
MMEAVSTTETSVHDQNDDGGTTHLWNVDAVSQKDLIFTTAAARIWNLTFICSLFNDMLSVTQTISYGVEWKGGKWMVTWEEIGSKRSWPNLRYYTGTSWRDWGKSRKNSIRIAGLRAEIWAQNLPNTTQECYTLDNDVR